MPGILADALDLYLLHAGKGVQETALVGIWLHPGSLQGQEQFVYRLYGRKALRSRLVLDDPPALFLGREHDAGEGGQAGACPQDLAGAGPCGVNKEYDKPASGEPVGGEGPFRQVPCVLPGVEEDRIVFRIVRQGAEPWILVKGDAREYLAAG